MVCLETSPSSGCIFLCSSASACALSAASRAHQNQPIMLSTIATITEAMSDELRVSLIISCFISDYNAGSSQRFLENGSEWVLNTVMI